MAKDWITDESLTSAERRAIFESLDPESTVGPRVDQPYVPTVGSEVMVTWGFNEIPGVVVEVYGTGTLARAMVDVTIQGSNGEAIGIERMSLPFELLRPAAF